MRETWLAIAACVALGGCAHAPPPACPRTAEPARRAWAIASGERVCSRRLVPLTFVFSCREASLEPDHEGQLDALIELTRNVPGVEGVILRGYQSPFSERDAPLSLAQRRAETIARALARRGYPPERMFPLTGGFASGFHPDRCQEPDRVRHVSVELLRCVRPEEHRTAPREPGEPHGVGTAPDPIERDRAHEHGPIASFRLRAEALSGRAATARARAPWGTMRP